MSFTLTWAEVIVLCPELSALTVPQQTMLLGDVENLLSETSLGSKYHSACRWLACHFGTLLQRGSAGATGNVSSEAVGSVSRSYSTGSIKNSDLESTIWGVQLSALINRSRGKAGVVLV